jgi:pectinesterase
VVVAADGSGNYTTVQAALDAGSAGTAANPYIIQVNPGTYRATVVVKNAYTQIIGAGGSASDTVIVYDNSAGTTNSSTGSAYGTQDSRTMYVYGKNSRVENLTISNDFDEAAHSFANEQAVALLTQADRLVFEDVRILGNQDTIFLKSTSTSNPNRVYFHDSYVEGDVDFLCGYATAVFDDTKFKMLSRGSSSNNGYLAAPSTDSSTKFGILVANSTITSDAPAGSFYLGRPWATAFGTALGSLVVRDTELPAAIKSAPYSDWVNGSTTYAWENSFFREYDNTGAGADNTGTNTERPQLTADEAAGYEVADYLKGTDSWAPQS